MKDMVVTVTEGNTALIPCEPPGSRPDALTVFEINGTTIDQSNGKYWDSRFRTVFLDRLLEFRTYCVMAAQKCVFVGLFTFYMQFKLTKSQLNFQIRLVLVRI